MTVSIVYLKGFAMGSADVVPGVSGGTIALIAGIYDRLITALTSLDPRVLRELPGVTESTGRRELKQNLEDMDVFFLLALGLGIMTAVVLVSRVMHGAITSYPVLTYSFFAGLILASAIILYREIDGWTVPRVVVSMAGVGLATTVAGVTATSAAPSTVVIFFAGTIAISAMVLPGISGAFFLLLLGQYEYLTGELRLFVDSVLGLLTGGGMDPVLETGSVIVTFGTGAIVGLFTISHIIRLALDRYRMATLVFLVSLMVGGLRLPIEQIAANIESGSPALGVIGVGSGILLVLLLDAYTDDLSYT
ncbi:MAG: DUF368 domain-containing protein [Natrialbaceae archaeon]|nr:DUF368 domain-containing protein [Natrialbaceae archaeon]